jgi:3-methylfumaryl-CoA hydratase
VSQVVEITDYLGAGPAIALAGLLGVDMPAVDSGEGLPLLWHWVYLLDRPVQSDLGPDGHPAVGGLVTAPAPGSRRMFAGGRVSVRRPLFMERMATRTSHVASSVTKAGRSGPLNFVTVVHEISQDGSIAIVDEQDIVYRAAGAASLPPKASNDGVTSADALASVTVRADAVLLFRFSALTYNAHRIHFDRDYARDVEGYPGLVVHGPLQAILMAEAVRAAQPPNRLAGAQRFEYRLSAPLFDDGDITAVAEPGEGGLRTRVEDARGAATASGHHLRLR